MKRDKEVLRRCTTAAASHEIYGPKNFKRRFHEEEYRRNESVNEDKNGVISEIKGEKGQLLEWQGRGTVHDDTEQKLGTLPFLPFSLCSLSLHSLARFG
jgi:hypothetical protein